MVDLTWSRSSIGRKLIVAVTGLLLLGFVFGHLAGNLLIFAGPEALNAYAKKLRDLGWLLWAMRIGLIATVLVHILVSIQLARENRAARPIGYAMQRRRETTLAGRTMVLSGLVLLVFIVYHLLHFTFRITHPELAHLTDALGRHDVYTMVVRSFHSLPLSAFYIVAMALLTLHLSHAVSSSAQTLGLSNERTLRRLGLVSKLIAVLIFVGYSVIPVAILLGMMPTGGGVG